MNENEWNYNLGQYAFGEILLQLFAKFREIVSTKFLEISQNKL
jgi:hypothetical protein